LAELARVVGHPGADGQITSRQLLRGFEERPHLPQHEEFAAKPRRRQGHQPDEEGCPILRAGETHQRQYGHDSDKDCADQADSQTGEASHRASLVVLRADDTVPAGAVKAILLTALC